MPLQDNLLRIKKKQMPKGPMKQQLPPLPDWKLSKIRKQPAGGRDQQVPAKATGDVQLQPLVQAILAGIGSKLP